MRGPLAKLFMIAWLAVLWACSGGAGSPDAALGAPPSGELSNQAAPVERPPVMVDSGPQEDCSLYRHHAEDFTAEEVPELCRDIWQYAIDHPLQVYTPPEVVLPTRVIPSIERPAVVQQDELIMEQPQVELRDQLLRDRFEIQLP